MFAKINYSSIFSTVYFRMLFSFLNFIYYFWLRWVFVVARRLSLVEVSGLLIAVASLVAEQGL